MEVQPQLVMQIELSISCHHLISLDVGSKSDPVVGVFLRNSANKWEEAGRTEVLTNDRNPRFATPIPIKYYFEEVQPIRFVVLDVDKLGKHESIKGKDKIGKLKCTVGDIVGSLGSTLTRPIEHRNHPGRKNGDITVKAVEIQRGLENFFVQVQLTGVKLDKKDLFSKSDPFLIIQRANDVSGTTGYTPVHKTEVIKNTLDPSWKPFELPVSRICGGNIDVPLLVECFDWDSDGSNDFIGSFTTTVAQLRSGTRRFELINEKIRAKKGSKYSNSGEIHFVVFNEYKRPSFLDFVTAQTEISLVVGVDYTGSNGDPSSSSSLHYRNPTGQFNEYQSAITAVGSVLEPYDNDRMIPAFGFGASASTSGRFSGTSHCFAMNGNEQNPEAHGIAGVMQSYIDTFNWVSLSGPTHFAPILSRLNSIASRSANGDKYFVLLMITDGAINDFAATVAQLKIASELPISIVIVGVGNADFSSMNALDDDDGQIGLKRDCVQFVPFRKFAGAPITALAKHTLGEIPQQLVSYMIKHNIQPRPVVAPVYAQTY